jgi:hypothetical protein
VTFSTTFQSHTTRGSSPPFCRLVELGLKVKAK